jgi:hypothetical protein
VRGIVSRVSWYGGCEYGPEACSQPRDTTGLKLFDGKEKREGGGTHFFHFFSYSLAVCASAASPIRSFPTVGGSPWERTHPMLIGKKVPARRSQRMPRTVRRRHLSRNEHREQQKYTLVHKLVFFSSSARRCHSHFVFFGAQDRQASNAFFVLFSTPPPSMCTTPNPHPNISGAPAMRRRWFAPHSHRIALVSCPLIG